MQKPPGSVPSYVALLATMGCIPVRRIQENGCTDIVSKNDLESNKDIYRVAAKKAVPYRLELSFCPFLSNA